MKITTQSASRLIVFITILLMLFSVPAIRARIRLRLSPRKQFLLMKISLTLASSTSKKIWKKEFFPETGYRFVSPQFLCSAAN
jgi:hypothetical protein